MPTSHFKTYNQDQDHVSGVALRAETEGGLRRATTVIVNYFFATLRPHSFRASPQFRGLASLIQHSLSRRSLTAKSENWA
jgi:hypothetical protein